MTTGSELANSVSALGGARVLCVGDVMLDRFVYGAVSRISPEAPIPVCRVASEKSMLGGAGNVARNIAALGARATFVAVVGDDDAGRAVAALVDALDSVEAELLELPGRPTTIKTRYIADGQQLLRADRETVDAIDAAACDAVLARVTASLEKCGAVVLSDYGKGVLGGDLAARVIDAARRAGKPVIVDPKGPDYAGYRGATLLTPNRRELSEASGVVIDGADDIARAAADLARSNDNERVLVTLGGAGMSLISAASEALHFPAEALEVFDVSGAGDTVAAMVATALAVGMPVDDAARLANAAAGIVVAKAGTAVAYADEIADVLRTRDLLAGEHKSVSPRTAVERVATWRARGDRVGFTNGCFDLIHPGHISLLHQARGACDRLIVGLNSDASTRRLKGADRPVQTEAARAAVLGSLAAVDLVVIFDDDTPLALIETLRPDVLVKGADYSPDQVVGADIVEGYGGRVLLADLAPGHSTTDTIARMGG
jgi:D-beta-D-heptose 7-phosphate kinase/D-beta-D-heptose 1-phosphate adenosyltransferase